MSGGHDNKKRFFAQRAIPVGDVTFTEAPIPVVLTLRISPPPLDYEKEGVAVAWTTRAVFCVWRTHDQAWVSGWIPSQDVRRL